MKLSVTFIVLCGFLFIAGTNSFLIGNQTAAALPKNHPLNTFRQLVLNVLSIFSPNRKTPAPKASTTNNKPTNTASKAPTPATKGSTFEERSLNAHNKYRKKHGVAPLTLDPTLTKFAQDWAKQNAKEGKMRHFPKNKYGENLYMSFSSNPLSEPKGGEAEASWYSEIKDYNYALGSKNNIKQIGHFTQMVWKGSQKLGVAKAKSKDGKWFVVAEYSPPGNVIGQFKANVPKPKA